MRGRGEGSIYRRADGVWSASIELPPGPDGKRRRRVFYAPTRREALAKLDRARNSIQSAGRAPSAREQRVTVSSLLDEWLESLKRPHSKTKALTVSQYEVAANTRVRPQLGALRISELDDDRITDWQDALLAAGYAPRSVLKARVILSGIIMLARRRKLLLADPLELVDPPAAQRPKKRAISGDEAGRLMATLRGHPYEDLIIATLLTGNRRGEVLGWRWQDVNLEAGTVRVQVQIQRIPGRSGLQVEPTKTEASERVLPLPSFLVERLRERRASQLPDAVFVFANPNGKPIEPRHYNRVFKQVITAAGLAPLTPHELRHSMSTILLRLGVSPVVVSQLLGHADASVTLRWYTHDIPDAQREAMARMDDFIRRIDEEHRRTIREPGAVGQTPLLVVDADGTTPGDLLGSATNTSTVATQLETAASSEPAD